MNFKISCSNGKKKIKCNQSVSNVQIKLQNCQILTYNNTS